MAKYKKRPVVIEAEQFNNSADIHEFCGDNVREPVGESFLEIVTLEGVMKASIGDFIIKGVNDEFYPCKPDIFEKTYELVREGSALKRFREDVLQVPDEKEGGRIMKRDISVTPIQFKFFTDVDMERDRQKKLYDNSDKNMDALLVIMVEEVGEVAKAIQNNDNKNLYEELTHAAAVCLQMAERI